MPDPRVVVFSGSAHRPLAQAICDDLEVPLSPVEMTRFSNDCLQAQLQANCRQRDVYIVQPLVPPTQEHLGLLLMIDAARGASAASITAVIPFYSYARSDKKDASRISIGGRLVADLLATAGVHRVMTMTLHAPQVHGFFGPGRPADRARHPRRALPQPGPQRRHRGLARLRQRQDGHPVLPALGLNAAAGSKRRLADDRVVIDSIVGDVEGKRGSCWTTRSRRAADRRAARPPRRPGLHGAAVACTHGLFVGKAVDRLLDHPMITEVVTTDTGPAPSTGPSSRCAVSPACSPRPSLGCTPASR